jgi:ABC-type transporter Mla MlaB component
MAEAASGKSEIITIDNLIELGYTKEDYDSGTHQCKINWYLSDITRIDVSGVASLFKNPIGKSYEEIAKSMALRNLKI